MELKTEIKLSVPFLLVGMLISTSISAQSTFKELCSMFSDSSIFYAEFEHIYIDSYTQERSTSLGEFWINNTIYKLTSEQQIIVVDGDLSKVYDASRNRLIISDYEQEDDDFGVLSRMLCENENYTSFESTLENGNTLIVLKTEDEFSAYITVEIEVDFMVTPIKITAYDIADNIVVTTFSRGEFFNKQLSIFEFTPPEDAEIIDMRH